MHHMYEPIQLHTYVPVTFWYTFWHGNQQVLQERESECPEEAIAVATSPLYVRKRLGQGIDLRHYDLIPLGIFCKIPAAVGRFR